MDSLFKRYANPFPLIDGMIRTGLFCDFVERFVEETNKENEEKTMWEYYLHRVFDKSFADFKASLEIDRQNQSMSDQAMETTIIHSMQILKNFSPDKKGGES